MNFCPAMGLRPPVALAALAIALSGCASSPGSAAQTRLDEQIGRADLVVIGQAVGHVEQPWSGETIRVLTTLKGTAPPQVILVLKTLMTKDDRSCCDANKTYVFILHQDRRRAAMVWPVSGGNAVFEIAD
jgi:hypothetical protein